MNPTSPVRNLVLLPGMDGTGALFRRFTSALPSEFNGVTAEYLTDRALGDDEMRRTAERLFPDSGSFVLLAESFSTPLAIQIASTMPPGLAGLILCAGFAASPVRGLRRVACRALAPLFFRIGLPGFAMRRWLLGPDADPLLVADVQAAVRRVKSDVLAARMRAVLDCDVRMELAQVEAPILYLHATNDRLVDRCCADEILRIKPQVELVSIDGPHLLLQREPEKAAEAVAEFVRRLA